MASNLDADDIEPRTHDQVSEAEFDDEGIVTESSELQHYIEASVLKIYMRNDLPILPRRKHIPFLKNALTNLSENYESLDCSRPWLCYWILHSLQLLGERLEDREYSNIVNFLGKCQTAEGGFGGGPGQYSHLATTYAAILALCTIGTEEAYRTINRETLQRFLMSLHYEDGSFSIHVDGEIDIRSVYCALVVAKLTNVYTPEMFKGTEEWLATCQSWEGGFGGCPGMEAHGGYTYCGLASLVLLGKTDFCSLPSLLRWIVNRQMCLEGGFQGRTNKLVDVCYSFWQGASFTLIHAILAKEDAAFNSGYWLFDQKLLQEYILLCCQHPCGGFVDKPTKSADIYHTCYALSGLSLAQNAPKRLVIDPVNVEPLQIINPLYNLEMISTNNALKYFNALPVPD